MVIEGGEALLSHNLLPAKNTFERSPFEEGHTNFMLLRGNEDDELLTTNQVTFLLPRLKLFIDNCPHGGTVFVGGGTVFVGKFAVTVGL